MLEALRRKSSKVARWVREMGVEVTSRHILARFLEDRRALGRIVEIGGNRGRLAGMDFDLASPEISTKLKSRFLLGTWELETRYLVEKHLPRDLPLVELGGCIGVVSCLANRLLADPSAHVVVEANERVLPILRANRARNRCRFEIVHAALAYDAPEVTFHLCPRCNEGRTQPWEGGTTVSVPSTTLEGLLDRRGLERVSLIADIEGAELDLVRREGRVLQERVEHLILETHGREESARTHEGLAGLGFRLIERFGDETGRNGAYRNTGLAAEPVGAPRREGRRAPAPARVAAPVHRAGQPPCYPPAR